MSKTRAIDFLPLDQFPTDQDTSDPGFEQLFGELVGIAGTDADGFDADIAVASSLLDSLQTALDAMGGQTGGTLDDTFAEILTVNPDDAAADVLNLQAALPGFSGNVDNLGNLIAGVTLPAPPAGGGGGGGGGGGPAPRPPCTAILGFGNPGPPSVPFTQSAYFHNPTNAPFKVTGVRFEQDQAGVYQMTNACVGVTLNPGDSCVIQVTITADPGPGVGAYVLIDTDTYATINLCCSTGVALGIQTGGGGVIRGHMLPSGAKHPVFGFCA